MNKSLTDYQIIQTLKTKSENEVFSHYFEKIVAEQRIKVLKHLVLTRPLLFSRHKDDCLHIILKNIFQNERLVGIVDYLFYIKADLKYEEVNAPIAEIFLKNKEMVYINNRLPNILLNIKNEEFMKLKYSDIVNLLPDAVFLDSVKVNFLLKCEEQIYLEKILNRTLYLSTNISVIEKVYQNFENKSFPKLLHQHIEHYEIFNFLVEQGLDINDLNDYGENPLMFLMHSRSNNHQLFDQEKDIRILRLCLEAGTRLESENKEKKMIYDYALYGTDTVWKLLLQKTDYKNPSIIGKLNQLKFSLENQNSFNPLISINKIKKIIDSFLEKVSLMNILGDSQKRTTHLL